MHVICLDCGEDYEIYGRMGVTIDLPKTWCRKCETPGWLRRAVFDHARGDWREALDDDQAEIDLQEMVVQGRRLTLSELFVLRECLDVARRMAGDWISAAELYARHKSAGHYQGQVFAALAAIGAFARVGLEIDEGCEGTIFRWPVRATQDGTGGRQARDAGRRPA